MLGFRVTTAVRPETETATVSSLWSEITREETLSSPGTVCITEDGVGWGEG